ncbi:cytochrome c551 [Priestia filamentosa]|uniref:cytochrome c551 n=1 Tax=Priestia filamentosa TaxID=1402861 RepID=UPI0002DBA2F9|nr:cytochrome c [Priestia filamentosa]
MKKAAWALIIGATLIMSGCGDSEEKSSSKEEKINVDEAGEAGKLYKQSCLGCHGDNLQGNNGPNLQQVGKKYSKEELSEIIVNGRGSMPKGLLEKEEANKVAEWLSTMK